MRIALTHNLQLTDSEEEAEFDSPATIEALRQALSSLGHDVELVEVSGPASRTVARLEALAPDLIFNTAEGRRGRFREAFYPALFEELGIPFTGSDAYVCALTLDKQLTKLAVAAASVPTPRWLFIDSMARWAREEKSFSLTFPVIVKPNFEGSSKGITIDSIVDDVASVRTRVELWLSKYPAGVLVEEFIEGRDLSVPWLQRVSKNDGVLPIVEYGFDPSVTGPRKHTIYDYELKQKMSHAVQVKAPAEIPPQVAKMVRETTLRVVKTLGIQDLCRIDFRLKADGTFYFLEVNALPSLEPGAGIYVAGALIGLDKVEMVLDQVIQSAASRYGISVKQSAKKRAALRVGLTYNLKRIKPDADGVTDDEAEYDGPATINALKDAIASYGYEVVDLEATPELPRLLQDSGVDVVFNVAEGLRGRGRESLVPALLELYDIPYSGSDPTTLSVALDKALAKRLVRQHGIPTADFIVMQTGKERLPKDFGFPAIVKPLAEGSSKGVLGSSVVEDEAALRERVKEVIGKYRQGALCEAYLPGREFTVGLLGESRPRVFHPLEIVFNEGAGRLPVYQFAHKLDWGEHVKFDPRPVIEPPLLREIERVARGAFEALGCRDVARIDVRLDTKGQPHFIECNPLPGLTPGFSDMCTITETAGMDYRTLVGEILAPALRRLRHKRKSAQAGRSEGRREKRRESGEHEKTDVAARADTPADATKGT